MAENKPVPIRIRPILDHYLKELVKVGAYGSNKSEVMRRFIENGVVQAMEGGVLDKKDIRDFGEDLPKDEESAPAE